MIGKASCVLVLTLAFSTFSAIAQETTTVIDEPPFVVSQSVELQTGDSWKENGKAFRLYGVQSCLRGTETISASGEKSDCGLMSLSRLAAIISTGTMSCKPIAKARDNAEFVVCGADISGNTIDVGMALISTGYAFAATDTKGNAINQNYLIAELDAKLNTTGLWATNFKHPVQYLLEQARRKATP